MSGGITTEIKIWYDINGNNCNDILQDPNKIKNTIQTLNIAKSILEKWDLLEDGLRKILEIKKV